MNIFVSIRKLTIEERYLFDTVSREGVSFQYKIRKKIAIMVNV